MQESKLFTALVELETALETPVIPGEVEQWAQAVQTSFDEVKPLIMESIEREHAQQFDTITTEDPELFRRVTQLKEEDQEIVSQLSRAQNSLQGLLVRTTGTDPHERQFENHIDQLVEKGLALIIQVRKQELAIQTWMTEAMKRDRGTVD